MITKGLRTETETPSVCRRHNGQSLPVLATTGESLSRQHSAGPHALIAEDGRAIAGLGRHRLEWLANNSWSDRGRQTDR